MDMADQTRRAKAGSSGALPDSPLPRWTQRLIRFLIGFVTFIVLAFFAVLFLSHACIELSRPHGSASPVPHHIPPPTLWDKAPVLLFDVALGFAALVAAAFVARWSIGTRAPHMRGSSAGRMESPEAISD
jgi:hypothetical protein